MTKRTSMEGETDEDLFIYIACATSPSEIVEAEQAFAEIHRRYFKGLYARCQRMLQAYPDGEAKAQELAMTAMARAYEKADKYKPDPKGGSGSSRTRAWLCKIAEHMYRDHLRNPRRPGPLNVIELDVNAEQYSPEDFAAMYLEDETMSYSRYHYKLVAEGYDALDDRTKTVLIETLVQRDRSRGQTYMLKGSAAVLADRLGTTTANLRRIRMNGIKAINSYVDKKKKSEMGQ